MGRKCCIAGCTSTSRLPEHHGVTYHSFPADENTRSIWIKNTKISSDRQITKSVLVCSRHFRRADFQPQRSGKYLLKQKVFPTVFPWGKVDTAQIEEDLEFLNSATPSVPPTAVLTTAADTVDEDTKATVAATVAQIMAQTAELNAAAAALKNEKSGDNLDDSLQDPAAAGASPGVKYEPVIAFNPGARLEAQDFEGVWHAARIVEVDNDDREVLIKFEKTGKVKSAIVGTEEWIPMNSSRLRQKISTKPIPVFTLEEKCLARWSGPRKFPGTVKKILGNDTYEVLFDDGYVKNVRAIHMNKISNSSDTPQEPVAVATSEVTAGGENAQPSPSTQLAAATPATAQTTISPGVKRPASGPSDGSKPKKRAASSGRKDWPLLDLSKLDIASLNLPEVPRDGEWACHWVNDQPIGREGFLIVGEHRKPTVIVDDWRLPAGWIKHMYQRSNVLGKWDVILVSPTGKRFRSKADLKTYLEEQGQVYNPDIYDFSIHRRRAKDINCYVYTPGYVPQQPPKPKSALNFDVPVENKPLSMIEPLRTSAPSPYMETPVAEPLPPIELLTSTSSAAEDKSVTQVEAEVPKQLLESAEISSTPTPTNTPTVEMKEEGGVANTEATAVAGQTNVSESAPQVEDGYALIGGLKVQIVDNLFRCPDEGCSKNFRKENHLQIHVKHYHLNLAKLLGSCPKMQELAEKRTRPSDHDVTEPTPKNQIPNQQFFAKLHQQDLEQTRAHRRSIGAVKPQNVEGGEGTEEQIKTGEQGEPQQTQTEANTSTSAANNSTLDSSFASTAPDDSLGNIEALPDVPPLSKKSRFSPSKRTPGARKSNRQRTTRKYLTAAQATASRSMQQNAAHTTTTSAPPPTTGDSSFSGVADFEETRHSFNATPEVNKDSKKRKSTLANTPLSSVESPITADSGSSSLHPTDGAETANTTQQYIKENGEIIKIVSMRQEEIINCLCKYGLEDGLMIQCELCLCWQHGHCHGIENESQVPDKYVCYICRHPDKQRYSMQFKHDQDWLYEGKLPAANYHTQNPTLMNKRADYLKRSHVLTGNLLELKNFMHSLKVKINIANNKSHPKLYLWATKWDEDVEIKNEIKSELDGENKTETIDSKLCLTPTSKKIKMEPVTPANPPIPNIPQPEAPIDPVECQQRLQEHIKIQQNLAMQRLNDIESAIDALEQEDDLPDLRDADLGTTKDVLASFIKELDTVKQIAKLNALEHTKMAYKNAVAAV
ncbi:uncharacterized protein LOC133333310 [Musca vetustissima]|uniref:uncharacterized protein LOC133333310 n=1 Tax=Musca vetustissima TaxID=27455 RepID=UPI002AB76BF5|nr:uncharacterized protein LOC133333310 [Musca vetustissima]